MKIKYISFALLILLAALGYSSIDLDSFDFDFLTSAIVIDPVHTSVLDTGSLQVYFCPHQDCEGALVSFLDSAQMSISCALFDIGLESVQAKLLEKSSEIEVKIVTDNDYVHKFNHSFVQIDSWGLMHNKFCIVDGKKISSGSMNPTNNGAHKNNNNLLFIDSSTLATNYQAEFDEMWQGTFKKGEKVAFESITFENEDITIHNYFCPDDSCTQHITSFLDDAKSSIQFMTFSFTSEKIANALLLQQNQGIAIKGVMEARQVTKYSKYDVLKFQIEDVYKDANKQNMHHKVFIIDEKIVVTGSMNPTAGGNTRNDENVLIIESEEIATAFVEEFEKVYNEAKAEA